ncbi:hypothetical protein Btru_047717 [Bulinus truncatus]|nr:hypothetical protein Btru_047717 [Bulinus truncatus]
MNTDRDKVLLGSGNGKSSCVSSTKTLEDADLLPMICTGVGDASEDMAEEETYHFTNVEHNIEKATDVFKLTPVQRSRTNLGSVVNFGKAVFEVLSDICALKTRFFSVKVAKEIKTTNSPISLNTDGNCCTDLGKGLTIPKEDKKVVLVVGRSGNGKSSCVNSIETLKSDLHPLECRGVGDAIDDLTEGEVDPKKVEDKVADCETKYGGVDAIVHVLKYGVRFTKQEKDAVAKVKSVFGADIFRTRGILVFTYGNNFEADSEGRYKFIEWCGDQRGDIKTLFEEVENRCVLFNNKSKEHGIEVSELITHVTTIRKQPGNKYLTNHLPHVKHNREKANEATQEHGGLINSISWIYGSLTNKLSAVFRIFSDKQDTEGENAGSLVGMKTRDTISSDDEETPDADGFVLL